MTDTPPHRHLSRVRALAVLREDAPHLRLQEDSPSIPVEQPMWMPKPHLTPLTGGYRRIPVMQIGADVYCDTALIVRKLDALSPGAAGRCRPASPAPCTRAEQWADKQLFMACVPLVFTRSRRCCRPS